MRGGRGGGEEGKSGKVRVSNERTVAIIFFIFMFACVNDSMVVVLMVIYC